MKGICVEVFCLFELLFGIFLGFFVKAFHLYQLQRDVFSFSCVISASSKRSEWQRSMALFEDMLQLSVPRNVTWLSTTISQMLQMGWGYLQYSYHFPVVQCGRVSPFIYSKCKVFKNPYIRSLWELCFNNVKSDLVAGTASG